MATLNITSFLLRNMVFVGCRDVLFSDWTLSPASMFLGVCVGLTMGRIKKAQSLWRTSHATGLYTVALCSTSSIGRAPVLYTVGSGFESQVEYLLAARCGWWTVRAAVVAVSTWGIDAMAAYLLCKQEVAGSSPVCSTRVSIESAICRWREVIPLVLFIRV